MQYLPPLLACLASAAAVIVVGAGSTDFVDARKYTDAAYSVLEGRGYPRYPPQPFFRPPMYPLLIAAVWKIAYGSILAIKVAQAALFAATCWLLYRFGRTAALGRRAAVIGASIFAVYPLSLLQVTDVQTEMLQTFLVVAGVLLLHCAAVKGADWRYGLGGGAVLGVASLTRPTALPVALVLALGVGAISREAKLLARLLAVSSVIAGLAVVLIPWGVLNLRATGDFILTTNAGGYVFWLGNHPAAIRVYEGDFATKQGFYRYSDHYLQSELPGRQIAKWEERRGYRTRSLSEREALWREEAFRQIREHPLQTLRLWVDKTVAYWRPWLRPVAYGVDVAVGSALVQIPLYVLAGLGVFMLWRKAKARALLLMLALTFFASTAVHTATVAMVRYRLPYVDPFLALLAAYPLSNWVARVRRRELSS